MLSRYGGEEFAALLLRSRAAEAEEVAERIRQNMAQRCFDGPGDERFPVTISIGVATFNPQASDEAVRPDGEILVGHADRALYDAKAAGRDRVVNAGEIRLGDGPYF